MDDGSKDDSFSIALKTIEGRGNCHLYRQKNAGVSMARNNGVALSQGEYLCFLDADDWWESTFLQEMDELIKEFPDAGIYGVNYTIVNETKHKTRVAKIGIEEGFEKGYINYCKAYASTMYMPLISISVAIPRRVFEEAGGFRKGIKLGEDFLLWIRIALTYKVAFLNKSLAYYNQDVDVANRGTNHVHRPEENMLWNLGFLEEEEKTNKDYKQLVDNLRSFGLLPYYLEKRYRAAAQEELDKVDWDRQPISSKHLYQRPVWLIKMHYKLMKIGSWFKQRIIPINRGI